MCSLSFGFCYLCAAKKVRRLRLLRHEVSKPCQVQCHLPTHLCHVKKCNPRPEDKDAAWDASFTHVTSHAPRAERDLRLLSRRVEVSQNCRSCYFSILIFLSALSVGFNVWAKILTDCIGLQLFIDYASDDSASVSWGFLPPLVAELGSGSLSDFTDSVVSSVCLVLFLFLYGRGASGLPGGAPGKTAAPRICRAARLSGMSC